MSDTIKYDAWPIGKLPKEFQRPELDQVKELGYHWAAPRDIIDTFEKKVARFDVSKNAVSIECDIHAIFLALILTKKNISKSKSHFFYP